MKNNKKKPLDEEMILAVEEGLKKKKKIKIKKK